MKNRVNVLLLFLFCGSLFRPLMPAFVYVLRYDYIVNTVCVEADETVNTCNGSCYLKKQMTASFEDGNPADKQERLPEIFLDLNPQFICGEKPALIASNHLKNKGISYSMLKTQFNPQPEQHPPVV